MVTRGFVFQPLILFTCMLATVAGLLISATTPEKGLQPSFYHASCPLVESVVRSAVAKAMGHDPRIAASLVRLFFHDCFVQGCDASILLDDSPKIISEKNALPNVNSVRGFKLIDDVKAKLEKSCPATVSCSDVLALAARDAAFLSGGLFWPVPLGRRDSLKANISQANFNLPGPSFNLSMIMFQFSAQGLDVSDLVTLSGAHTFGRASCKHFRDRLYNSTNGRPDPTMDAAYMGKLRMLCPRNGDKETIVDFDPSTPNSFDNEYFKHLMKSRGLLQSDQVLFSSPGAPTKALVENFSKDEGLFFRKFALSMTKMGNINVLTGRSGEIRVNCRRANNS